MNHVIGWWDELTLARQLFYGIGIVAGVVALVLAVLSFIGLEHHDGMDALGGDIDGSGGGIFSIKPLTGFFLGFGWAGGLALESGFSVFAALIFALLAGATVMGIIVAMFRAIFALRSDGTMRIADTLGAVGTVYVTVPALRAPGGQVTVSFSGRQETFAALSSGPAPIPSGEKIQVVEVVDTRTLLVVPLNR